MFGYFLHRPDQILCMTCRNALIFTKRLPPVNLCKVIIPPTELLQWVAIIYDRIVIVLHLQLKYQSRYTPGKYLQPPETSCPMTSGTCHVSFQAYQSAMVSREPWEITNYLVFVDGKLMSRNVFVWKKEAYHLHCCMLEYIGKDVSFFVVLFIGSCVCHFAISNEPNSLYGCFQNTGTPNHPLKNRVFHDKPSILGYPYFWKHPYIQYILSIQNFLVLWPEGQDRTPHRPSNFDAPLPQYPALNRGHRLRHQGLVR